MMKRWILFIFIVAPLVYFLTFALMRDARELPSVLIGKEAPDFYISTLDGKTISLKTLKGKPVVLNFWATWCSPCLLEHETFKEAIATYGKEGPLFFGVLYQDEAENARHFIEDYGKSFEVLLDPSSKTAVDYGVGGVPETFFIDAEGIVRAKVTGVLSLEKLQQQIEKLRASNSKSEQARHVADQLRCPVCRGIPIAESPSPLAQDMMQIIHEKTEEGQTEEEILNYFESRYGEWILLSPKPKGLNLMMWILPAAAFFVGAFVLIFSVKRWTRKIPSSIKH